MVGYFKYISKKGEVQDICINIIKSDKDVYDWYNSDDSKKCKNISISNIDYTPVYKNELLKDFNYLKSVIEKEIRDSIKPQEVKTTTILKNNERLKKLQKLFGLEPFTCNDEYVLAPASDFGIFSLFQDTNFKINQLPFNVYEFAKCYRVEDKKKDALKRPTTFHLPDVHCFIKNNVYEEVKKHLHLYSKILNKLKIPFFVSLRISVNEFLEHKEQIIKIARDLEKGIIVNIVPNSIKYWESKFKYIYKSTDNEYIQLSTVQVDYKTSDIFNIREGGENITIIHSSIGSIERVLYSYLDK